LRYRSVTLETEEQVEGKGSEKEAAELRKRARDGDTGRTSTDSKKKTSDGRERRNRSEKNEKATYRVSRTKSNVQESDGP
jgi:hypothetical protein